MNTAQIDGLEDLQKLQDAVLKELNEVIKDERQTGARDFEVPRVQLRIWAHHAKVISSGLTNLLTAVKAAAAYETVQKSEEVKYANKLYKRDFLCGVKRQPNPFLEAVDQVSGGEPAKERATAILEALGVPKTAEWPKEPPPKATKSPRKRSKPGKHSQQAKTVARFVQDQDNLAGSLYGKRVIIPVYEEARARHQANRLNCQACGYENTRKVTKNNTCAACRYKAGIGILPKSWNEFVRKTLQRVWRGKDGVNFDPTLIKPYSRAPEEAMAIYNAMRPKEKITKHKQELNILENSLKIDPCPACHKTGIQEVTKTKPCKYCGWRDGTGVEPKDWKKYVRNVLQFNRRVRRAKQQRTTKRDKKPTKKLELTPDDFEELGAQ